MPINLENIDLGSFGGGGGLESTVQDNQLNASISEAVKINPDQRAQTTELSKQSGVPEFAVENNPVAVESQLKLDNIDTTTMSKRNPNTAKYLTDFNNASIAHDDIDIMQEIEDIFDFGKTFENLGESISSSFTSQGAGLMAAGVDMTPTRIQDLVPASGMPIGMEGDAAFISMELASNLGIDTDEQLQQAKVEATEQMLTTLKEQQAKRKTLTPEDLNLLEQGVRSGVESLANMAPGFGLMLLSGGRATPLLATIGVQTFGDSYAQARADDLTPQQSAWFASINAAIEVGTEVLPTGTLEQILTGQRKGLTKAALKFLVQEMGTEQLATLGQTLNENAFGIDEQMEQAETVEEMVTLQLRRQAVTAIATIVAGGAQATAVTGIRKTIEVIAADGSQKETQGDVEQRKLDQLNTAAEQSKLKARSKESFKQFVEQADGDNNTHVFIDGAQTSLYLQTKTPDEIAADPALSLLHEQAREAAALGGEVSIPVAEFTTEIAGTEHFEQLRDSMTMSEDTVAPFRQEQVQQETQAYIRTLLDDANENVSEYVEAQEIYTTVRAQLVDSGQVNAANASIMAQIVPAWATAQAKSSGKTVQQVYADAGLTIEGPLTGEAARLETERGLLTQEQIDLDFGTAEAAGFQGGTHGEAQQWVAAKQKGLDLSENSRKARAVEQGFDVEEVLYHGTTADFSEFNVDAATGKSFDTGVFLSNNQQVANSYAGKNNGRVIPTYIKAENPLEVLVDTGTNWDNISDENSTVNLPNGESTSLSELFDFPFDESVSTDDVMRNARAAGFDVVTVEGLRDIGGAARGVDLTGVDSSTITAVFDPSKIRSVNAAFDPDAAESADLLAQRDLPADRNLVVTHNLSAENILAAADLGGLAAPSIATIRADISDFDQFGEVSLLADPSLLESPKARTFDADVYTPRQPRATYDIDEKKFNQLNNQLDPDNLGLSKPDIQSLADGTGADNLQRSAAIQHLWLQEQGKAPKLKSRKASPTIKKAAKIEGFIDAQSPEIKKLATKHYKDLLKKVAAADEGRVERYEGLWFEEDGSISARSLIDFTGEVRRFKESNGVDTHQLRQDIDKKLRTKKTRDEYDQWAADLFNDMVTGQKLFKGFTNAGNRKYVDYNMQNVVKEMTQKLQAGEASFYGAGTVRSAFANEMKTIRQVQNRRDQIVTEAEMTEVKQDSADILEQALDDLKPFYKFDADSFGYAEDAGNAIMEGRKGLNEAFDMTPEAQQIVDDLVNYLVALPSSYFETKIQRAVGFDEFDTAVVPKGMNKQALQVLKDAGLKIKTYDPSGKGKTRQQVVAEQEKLLFQPTSDDAPGARGYYDPANSIIRLTESADLSTFLHEFAHFMYEMEVSGDTELLQSINNWYKRNGEEVAAEANRYLTKKGFDAEKQGDQLNQLIASTAPLETEVTNAEERLAQRKQTLPAGHKLIAIGERVLTKAKDTLQSALSDRKGFDAWFADSKVVDANGEPQVVFHGSNRDIKEFRRPKSGRALWASASSVANTYAGVGAGAVVFPTYMSMQKPMEFDAQNSDWQNLEFEGEHTNTDDLADLAESRGFDGLIVRNLRDEDSDTGGDVPADHYAVFKPEQIKSSVGNIGAFDPTNPEILAQEATPPTGKAGSITGEDVTTYLDSGTTGDADKDSAIRRAVHEQFARGFETYLMEGKAPSIELRNAFRTFARWLSQIYQRMRGDLNVDLTVEMRQVFDRLLATEEQIAAAEARQRVEPMFTDAVMAGMTEEEFSDYQKRISKVKDVQSETLRDKLIKQLTRQQQKWWNEEKRDIADEEIERLKTEQVHVARDQLKTGDIKLDFATVKEMVGEEKVNKLGRKSVIVSPKLRGMTAKEHQGLHPDEAAAILGYDSGSELLDDLINAPSIKESADIAAESRMVDRHGDIMTDGTIEKAADEAVQDEERGKLLLSELKTLARGTNAPTVDRATIKEIAAERIGRLSSRQIFPGKYRSAEIKAANEAGRMLAEGNKEGAAAAKMRQVLNYYLGMEATNAKNETVKIVDRMARYSKKKVQTEIMKSNGGHWEQIVKILNRFEFRKSATLGQVDAVNENINIWAKERMETEGDGLVLTPAVLNESFITHWKNVPFSDLQGINDSVKNIEHVARYSNKMNAIAEELEFKKLKGDWVDSINTNDARFDTKASKSRTADAQDATLSEHVRRWASQLTKVPFLASWLDGGERVGLSHQILIQPLTDALDAKLNLVDSTATPVNNAILDRSKADQKRHMRKIWIPEINDHLLGHQVLAVALNTGNQGNLRKLLLGEGWADPESDTDVSLDNPQLQAVLKHMTKSDWELVQLIWDQMETLYPQLSEVHRRTTGLTPPKVESTPVVTEFGTFRGGYYPVKYSPERSHKAEKNAEKLQAETESMFNNTASIQASVNAGSTNERTGFYDRINLSLDVVPDHFNETIHYITHHDAVRQINKLINAPDVANAISGVLGEAEYKQLKPWLNDVAKDGRQQPTKTFIDEAFQRLRFGTTLGVMGFKASTGIMQFFGLFTTAAEIGVGPTVKGIQSAIGNAWYMKAIRRTLGTPDNMQSGWDFAVERSKVMQHRAETMDREIRNAMTRLKGKRGIIAATQEASMKHIALIQTYMVDLPTWLAAYDKTVSETGDEKKAAQVADFMVESLQGSGSTKDMAAIVRNQSKVLTTFTMFMTFFSSLGNLSRDLVKGARTGRYSPTSIAAKLMFLYTIPVFMEMLMRGELDEPEDEDDRLGKYATGVALYPLASIPFVRDVASGLIGDFGYNSSPVASMLEKGISGFKGITTAAVTDKEVTKSQIKNATKLVGAGAGVPGVSQMWATGEHLYDVIEEGEEFTVREALFGPKRD